MRFLFILYTFFIVSCTNNSKNDKINLLEKRVENSKENEPLASIDSLDTDTTDYIYNFIDSTAHDTIYYYILPIRALVTSSYKLDNIKNKSIYSLPLLGNELNKLGFHKNDSTFSFRKRSFNKRIYLYTEDQSKSKLKVIYGMDWWHKGKKYRLIGINEMKLEK